MNRIRLQGALPGATGCTVAARPRRIGWNRCTAAFAGLFVAMGAQAAPPKPPARPAVNSPALQSTVPAAVPAPLLLLQLATRLSAGGEMTGNATRRIKPHKPMEHRHTIDTSALTSTQLHAVISSGGRCPASVYRTVWSVADVYDVEPSLVVALIDTESSCRSNAVSPAGAMGLMQLLPEAGGRAAFRAVAGNSRPFSARSLRDPSMNIRLGVAYLHLLSGHFQFVHSEKARELLAVASYNCGYGFFDDNLPGAAADWQPREAANWIVRNAPSETRAFFKNVVHKADRYAVAIAAAEPELISDAVQIY